MMFRFMNVKKEMEQTTTASRQSTRRINVKPSRNGPKAAFVHESNKGISPPPAYGDAIKTIFNTQTGITETGSIEGYRTVNGRSYALVKNEAGATQLIPTRAPSAGLLNYQLAYNTSNYK